VIEAERVALRRRYAEERDKRLRLDGNDQYLELKGPFSRMLDDPYTPQSGRDPKRDHVTVAFVGGGFAGLVTGARLKKAGIGDVRIVEKGGGFGGTWYWNRYPGAQCDTEVTDLEWDASGRHWIVRTNRADEFTARFVGIGTGPLHVAKLPGIPGIETFEGHAFHTSRWDYAYTGGDPDGAPMNRLAGQRVAIIGTGATSVLCKRPCFHDEYLSAYNLPSVHLVDTGGQGVERITPAAVVVAGVEYPVDCIIYASSFEVGTEATRRYGFDMTGRDGTKLSDYWSGGMRSMHGVHVHGFPNAFHVQLWQGGNVIANVPHNLTDSAKTVAAVVSHMAGHGFDAVEVTREAEDAWMELLIPNPVMTSFLASCTPGYYNNEGHFDGQRFPLGGGYNQGAPAYFRYIGKWRASGDFASWSSAASNPAA